MSQGVGSHRDGCSTSAEQELSPLMTVPRDTSTPPGPELDFCYLPGCAFDAWQKGSQSLFGADTSSEFEAAAAGSSGDGGGSASRASDGGWGAQVPAAIGAVMGRSAAGRPSEQEGQAAEPAVAAADEYRMRRKQDLQRKPQVLTAALVSPAPTPATPAVDMAMASTAAAANAAAKAEGSSSHQRWLDEWDAPAVAAPAAEGPSPPEGMETGSAAAVAEQPAPQGVSQLLALTPPFLSPAEPTTPAMTVQEPLTTAPDSCALPEESVPYSRLLQPVWDLPARLAVDTDAPSPFDAVEMSALEAKARPALFPVEVDSGAGGRGGEQQQCTISPSPWVHPARMGLAHETLAGAGQLVAPPASPPAPPPQPAPPQQQQQQPKPRRQEKRSNELKKLHLARGVGPIGEKALPQRRAAVVAKAALAALAAAENEVTKGRLVGPPLQLPSRRHLSAMWQGGPGPTAQVSLHSIRVDERLPQQLSDRCGRPVRPTEMRGACRKRRRREEGEDDEDNVIRCDKRSAPAPNLAAATAAAAGLQPPSQRPAVPGGPVFGRCDNGETACGFRVELTQNSMKHNQLNLCSAAFEGLFQERARAESGQRPVTIFLVDEQQDENGGAAVAGTRAVLRKYEKTMAKIVGLGRWFGERDLRKGETLWLFQGGTTSAGEPVVRVRWEHASAAVATGTIQAANDRAAAVAATVAGGNGAIGRADGVRSPILTTQRRRAPKLRRLSELLNVGGGVAAGAGRGAASPLASIGRGATGEGEGGDRDCEACLRPIMCGAGVGVSDPGGEQQQQQQQQQQDKPQVHPRQRPLEKQQRPMGSAPPDPGGEKKSHKQVSKDGVHRTDQQPLPVEEQQQQRQQQRQRLQGPAGTALPTRRFRQIAAVAIATTACGDGGAAGGVQPGLPVPPAEIRGGVGGYVVEMDPLQSPTAAGDGAVQAIIERDAACCKLLDEHDVRSDIFEVTADMRAGVFSQLMKPEPYTGKLTLIRETRHGEQRWRVLAAFSEDKYVLQGMAPVLAKLKVRPGDVLAFRRCDLEPHAFFVRLRRRKQQSPEPAAAPGAVPQPAPQPAGAAVKNIGGGRDPHLLRHIRVSAPTAPRTKDIQVGSALAVAAAEAAPASTTASSSKLPVASISYLHGYVPPQVGLPPLQPGELRVCGLTFHPQIAPWVSAVLNSAGRDGPAATRQMFIPGVDSPAGVSSGAAADVTSGLLGPSTAPTAAAAAAMEEPWLHALRSRRQQQQQQQQQRRLVLSGLDSETIRWDLANKLGLKEGMYGVPLPTELNYQRCWDKIEAKDGGGGGGGGGIGSGGQGLVAREAILCGEVVGLAGGYVLPSTAAAEELVGLGCKWLASEPRARLERALPSGGRVDPPLAWALLAGWFSLPYKMYIGQQALSVAGAAGGGGIGSRAACQEGPRPEDLALNMLGYGNLAALIQDSLRDPWGSGGRNVVEEQVEAEQNANCAVIPVVVRGITLPVVVALRDIPRGEPLLRDFSAALRHRLRCAYHPLRSFGVADPVQLLTIEEDAANRISQQGRL